MARRSHDAEGQVRRTQARPIERWRKIGPDGLMDDEWERPPRDEAERPRSAGDAAALAVDEPRVSLGAIATGWLAWLMPGRRPIETPS
jgi:hypothetical protein